MLLKNVFAKVVGDGKKRQTVYENPVKPGDIVAVDELTYRNLSRKAGETGNGLAEASEAEVKAHLEAVKKAEEKAKADAEKEADSGKKK